MAIKFKKRISFPFIQQRDMSECGTTCLAMIFKYYGMYNIQSVLRDLGHVTNEGTDLYTLSEIAELFGFQADGYSLTLNELSEIQLPCVAHYEGNHFVVIYKVDKTHVWIADPAVGKDKLTLQEFAAKWNGIALIIEPTERTFKNKDVLELIEQERTKKKNIVKEFYLSLLYPYKKVIVAILVGSLMLQLLGLALPFFTQGIIDKVLVHKDQKLLFAILIGMMGVLLLQIVFTYARNIMLTQLKVHFELEFFSKFFNHLIHLTQSYFDAHKKEDFINRFQENLKIRSMFSASVLEPFLDFIFVFNLIIVLFFYNPMLAFVALAFMIFFICLTIYYTPKLAQLEEKVFNENVKTLGSYLDTLQGMQTVKLLNVEKLKFWEWKNKYRKSLNKVFTSGKTHVMFGSTLSVFNLLGQLTIYWLGAYLAFKDELSIGQYIAFISIYSIIMHSISNVSSLWFMATELSVTYNRLNDVFIQEPEKMDMLTQYTLVNKPTIELKNVFFKYAENSDEYALKDLSLKINYGEHIGIVGRNGSGKTTLVKLLAKIYSNYQGYILFDNVEMKNIHPQHLRKKVFMIPQEVFIFSGTIKENILMANPKANTNDVIRAAKLADIHDFIQTLYLGYNYKIGEGGANLSGGQKLKVAFARLFLSNPDVIIMDEASSALDIETEQKIMKNVKEHFKDKTIISIAHRLTTLKNANKIIVIDKGTIVEQGVHDELIKQNNLYAKFMKTYVDF